MTLLSRRNVIHAIAGSGAYAFGCGCSKGAQSLRGCSVDDPRVYSNSKMSVFAFAGENVVKKSGVQDLDGDLSFALKTLKSSFSVDPGFAYYDDGQIGNSGASKKSLFEGSKGTVLFGLTLLKGLLDRPQSDAAIVAICAHEFGHIVAYDTNLFDQLVPDLAKPLRGEQHADYLAGFFAGQRKLIHRDYPSIVFLQTLRSLAGGGHGSEDQRAEAVWMGFKAAYEEKLSFEDGIEKGFEWAIKRPEA